MPDGPSYRAPPRRLLQPDTTCGAEPCPSALAAIGVASVIGDFFMKFTTIKAGVYRPLRLHQSFQRA